MKFGHLRLSHALRNHRLADARKILFWQDLKEIWLVIALVPAAALQLSLSYFMPAQYKFVLTSSLQQTWPAVVSVSVMAGYFVAVAWLMRSDGRHRSWLLVLAAVPVLAQLWGIVSVDGLNAFTGLLILLGVVPIFLLTVRRQRLLEIKGTDSRHRHFWSTFLAFLIPYLGLGIATIAEPISISRQLGSLIILSVFSGTLSICLCVLALKRRIAAFVLLYLIVSYFFFEPNNHRIPHARAKSTPMQIDDAFSEWVNSRRDLGAYRNRGLPYPVIFVSSEGGGIYAAAHAYGTLSELARNCPTFSQHVFATVGVSGGALGNVLFSAAQDSNQSDFSPCKPTAGRTSSRPIVVDHLSPVLARMLLLEPLDRLLPGQWLKMDRAHILAHSFLSSTDNPRVAEAALSDSFDPRGARPAVISVATDIATGRRFVMSPFHPLEFGQTADWWPGGVGVAGSISNGNRQISLIQAAGLSARFPWITPTGRLEVLQGEDRILADGGYFENSGADTVFDLINSLRISDKWETLHDSSESNLTSSNGSASDCISAKPRVAANFHEKARWNDCEIPVFLIFFSLSSAEPADPDGAQESKKTEPVTQSFLFDPISVLLATRSSRADVALSHMDIDRCGTWIGGAECFGNPGASFGMFRNDISPMAWKLPLGWYMPKTNFDKILSETARQRYFGYRANQAVHESDTELMIYHLDPSLYDEGARPSINDLMGGP